MASTFPVGVDTFSTKVDRGIVYAAHLNSLQEGLVAVQNFLRLKNSPTLYDYDSADPTGNNDSGPALAQMITELNNNTYGGVARGGDGVIPPGVWVADDAITISSAIKNISLVGASAEGSSLYYKPSIIKGTDTTKPVFDLGNNLISHLKLKNLGIVGLGGTNLLHRGIYAAYAQDLILDTVFFNNFGGSAILLDAGVAIELNRLFVTGAMLGYAGLGADAGVVDIRAGETTVTDSNINGPGGDFGVAVIDGGNTHLGTTGGGVVGGGGAWLSAFYAGNNLMHLYRNTFAFAHYGAKLKTLTLGHNVEDCRFEFNQRHGLWTDAVTSRYEHNRFQDNSQEANGTYAHCKVGSGVNGYGNVWLATTFYSISYQAYKPNYGFDVQAGGGTTAPNEVVASGGTGFNLAMYSHTGSQPLLLQPKNQIQQVDTATNAQTITFDSQGGAYWIHHLTAAAATSTLGVPLYPITGTPIVIDVFNQTGGGTTVTFNAVFKTSGYTDPANGKHRTARFRYNGTNWMQEGDWSGDL